MDPETRRSIARPPNFQTRPTDHRFFSIMSVVTSVTIVAGFWSTYLPKILSGAPALPPIIHVHAAIAGSHALSPNRNVAATGMS